MIKGFEKGELFFFFKVKNLSSIFMQNLTFKKRGLNVMLNDLNLMKSLHQCLTTFWLEKSLARKNLIWTLKPSGHMEARHTYIKGRGGTDIHN